MSLTTDGVKTLTPRELKRIAIQREKSKKNKMIDTNNVNSNVSLANGYSGGNPYGATTTTVYKPSGPNYSQIHQARLKPALWISPQAWLKIIFARDLMDTEVGFMGISSIDDPLYIEEVKLIKQETTTVTVEFDDDALADYFVEMDAREKQPAEFGRLWIHTHPGSSTSPSGTDEETFHRVFGECDWACMIIIGKTNETYCRLRYNSGPKIDMIIPVHVDWKAWPDVAIDPSFLADLPNWKQEVVDKVHPTTRGWAATQTSGTTTGVTAVNSNQTGFATTSSTVAKNNVGEYDSDLRMFVQETSKGTVYRKWNSETKQYERVPFDNLPNVIKNDPQTAHDEEPVYMTPEDEFWKEMEQGVNESDEDYTSRMMALWGGDDGVIPVDLNMIKNRVSITGRQVQDEANQEDPQVGIWGYP